MPRSSSFAIVILFALSACGDSAARDLDKLCTIATEVRAQGGLDDSRRATELARRAEAEIHSEAVRNIFEALAMSDAKVRPEILRRGAEEVGAKGWTCPALDELLGSRAGR